ncbi:hypothetical protein F2Q70_00030751 [Brassica cretica]|uniref:Uncharacterized protein n=1 Tax=Brassica cretica TaxID=69181 RepID=A0A8S9FFN3_BRACR|nr:hypothetical protein F2Q70_00030751 [Brassica cretica]
MVHFRFISQVKYWNPSAGLEFFSIFIFDGKRRKMFLLIGLPLSVKKFVPENCASSGETTDLNDTQFTKLDELLTQTQLYSKAQVIEFLSQKAKMADTISLALAAAKKLKRSPASLRCKPATNVLITMSRKKRMKAIGRVDVLQEAFMALKLEKEVL